MEQFNRLPLVAVEFHNGGRRSWWETLKDNITKGNALYETARGKRGKRDMATEGITDRTIKVNGINMHVTEKGEGPVVLFIHGFPELWYTWRHQINAVAARGYRAVAPDLRGYGDTDAPPSVTDYSIFSIVGDLIALLDALGQDKVHRREDRAEKKIPRHITLFLSGFRRGSRLGSDCSVESVLVQARQSESFGEPEHRLLSEKSQH